MKVIFSVAGSAKEPYQVTFRNEHGKLNAFCTCPAGEKGLHCKHRLAIVAGDTSAVLSKSREEIEILRTWLIGSELEIACSAFHEAEKNFEEAKAMFDRAKKRLGKVMTG
ncbi:MAG TPA: SWIM zinc finger family protein [Lamprocystis sp. (in: g-proteobacteria)]|nr:SWIM zinc finger family protein [Lamprocystis sp. (in: g-proteobacteria)]